MIFVLMLNSVILLILVIMGQHTVKTNKRSSYVPTYERLDHYLGNAKWCQTFPSATIYIPMMCIDHTPILAVLSST
jgi:hypothetical protein